jgi:hypothetical protein
MTGSAPARKDAAETGTLGKGTGVNAITTRGEKT